MIHLNAALLDGVGLGTLPPDAQASLLKSVKASLQETVGWRIALRLTDPEMDEISNLIDSGDERGALAWLDSHVPEHRDIVRAAVDEITQALRNRGEEIIASALAESSRECGNAV